MPQRDSTETTKEQEGAFAEPVGRILNYVSPLPRSGSSFLAAGIVSVVLGAIQPIWFGFVGYVIWAFIVGDNPATPAQNKIMVTALVAPGLGAIVLGLSSIVRSRRIATRILGSVGIVLGIAGFALIYGGMDR